ncbi:MAG: type I DNA topoisomerase [Candidatus Portnoybacteria bacterium CG10_big_fil_rev_8_21_14_0_10_40_22]|uniref:DNA topoisomerase 1 n=1 Tax=Candidatus Portnoybacteria bacterium CG10_big_fil_rev_8_21_14_0_10_40_22 TaxID=1974814 RepID=A0A2M8KGF0_9BACT|nr:MAG: type I DNA topoisomerase [Candidatus Portnoybacteria bacterium CG10_big_fil_rev_8_21_14_0_10_40_22]
MKLVIVESPTKAKTISQFLRGGFKVESSFGHVRDLPRTKLGVDVDHNFEPQYVIPKKVLARVKELQAVAEKSDEVILATDEDREGEAIAWHLLQVLRLGKFQVAGAVKKIVKTKTKKPYSRIVFHEITERAIEAALNKPRDLDLNLVDAQQARRVLDRLVGYKLSPFLWKKIAKGLSAGRVQSVAVRLIVEREREITVFKPDEYWEIVALLRKLKNESFEARLIKKDNQLIDKLGIKNQVEADQMVKDLQRAGYQVAAIEKKEVRRSPLAPFTTSTLQQEAANRLGFSARQTMRLAQQLYEGVSLGQKAVGLITYMRTDSVNLSGEFLSATAELIIGEFGKNYHQEHQYKTKSKLAQEAHEAVRPTSAGRSPETIKSYLNKQQYQLYDLIWRRALASQMAQAIFDATKIDISANNYLFRANGSAIKFDGFLKLYPLRAKENILPELSDKEILELVRIDHSQHFTQPPARYSEATLVKALEEYGIGRPSTYAPIISVIQDRGYVAKNEQRKFIPTEIGFMVSDILVENFPKIVDLNFTAKMEGDLDEIADGKKQWVPVIREFYDPFALELKEKYLVVKKQPTIEETDRKCPQCGKPVIIRLGRFGKFYACSGFPECRFTEALTQKDNKTGVKCPKCGVGEIIGKRSRKGKVFFACDKWPECDYALWNKPTGEKCPQCGEMLIEAGKTIKCSKKECSFKRANELAKSDE